MDLLNPANPLNMVNPASPWYHVWNSVPEESHTVVTELTAGESFIIYGIVGVFCLMIAGLLWLMLSDI
ncbi:hypothetical protein TARRARE_6 [Escherichia phage vB_Ec_Tarrare]|uniref:Uncharacterized protein n=1 Tax=Escherichia phage vB_Ec_Tarrare TaxID=3032379 RepID=A0AAF0D4S5_9CAUD|nr:hypothetical protein TARRARE_6 [Escherichia phage vB_Ec_Tarrare]